MANSVQKRFGKGLPISFTCAEPVLGGQLVERRAGSRIVGVAGAASAVVAGVALHDVPAARKFPNGPQVGDGLELTVERQAVLPVTFTAAAAPGEKLVAAANGQVTPVGAAAASDARQIVGEAFDAVGAGAVGLAVIY